MFEINELIKELYSKYPELSKSELELICRTQFRFIWETIQSGEFKTISIKHLGKFIAKPKSKVFWLNKMKDVNYIEHSEQRGHKRYKIPQKENNSGNN